MRYCPTVILPLPAPLRFEAMMLVLDPDWMLRSPPEIRLDEMLVLVVLMVVEDLEENIPLLWLVVWLKVEFRLELMLT